ncbi:hypothetical protein SAY87_003685 [Trapa incisa]|uniref:Exostosin GT47 domain-containing protein n=1 Tax=Trapa incisa TaxID=236973 RepID=A0AAN7QIA0_9MYRT|nr:hypothetical protein SAY87_003685 [Trapa incisa]
MVELYASILRLRLIDTKRLLLIGTIMIAIIVIIQGVIATYDQSFRLSWILQERGTVAIARGGDLDISNATGSDVPLILPPGLERNYVDNGEDILEVSDGIEGTSLDNDVESDGLTDTPYMGDESNLTKKLGTNGVVSIDNDPTKELDQHMNFSMLGSATTISLEASFNVIGPNKSTNVKEPKNIHAEAKRTAMVNNGSALKRLNAPALSIAEMNLLLVNNSVSSKSRSTGKKRPSARDQELLSAKLEIMKAPVEIDTQGLQGFVYQNISQFIRSYELMERILKVYVYKEGEKPIFHKPKPRGIYASEGWFMKLMEGNKKFLVRDPRKAHLFYMPFSSQMLRTAIDYDHNFKSHKDLMKFLKSYIDLISHKYRFWNRTSGADHFLVACHDWATRISPQEITGNSIRSLCNSNAAKGFHIGKDTTLPVTYVRSMEEPTRDLGGKPPFDRPILAFFAGSMHGYLRPILLQYWENRHPDMKIFGPLPRDLAGKKTYREYMKSSKFCICARGYEVHTPRVVEAIFYECVPVIISDNYVPPFFEVLKWEEFAVFVKEKNVPNLGRILSSISEEKYLRLQRGVKAVQRHFIWHKKPIKFDLFHMVLHSVWHIRMLQLKQGY